MERYALKTPLAWRHIKHRYGITKEEYIALYERQQGVCAISGIPLSLERKPKEGTKYAVVDHDHETGAVRGLLCPRINVALGAFNDDPELLRKTADYIEKHQQNKPKEN
jgi:hypothetical protein